MSRSRGMLKALASIRSSYRDELQSLSEFLDAVAQMLTPPEADKSLAQLSTDEIADMEEVADALANVMAAGPTRSNRFRRIKLRSSRTHEILVSFIRPLKHRSYFGEMSLVYVVSLQEAFVKEYLRALLEHRPEMLSRAKMITYEEALAYEDREHLISALAESEVSALGRGSIDEVASDYEKRLNVELTAYSKWNVLREASFRRNAIVHNRGRADATYSRKIPSVETGTYLNTDIEYVKNTLGAVIQFINYVHAVATRKFRRRMAPSDSACRPLKAPAKTR